MIDTHAHLYLKEFKDNIKEVVNLAINTGIEQVWLPGIDFESLQSMENLQNAFPGYFKLFAGLHPCDVKENYLEEIQKILAAYTPEKYTGIGEIGLDLYWDKTFFEQQKTALKLQLDFAVENKIPVILHVRDASEEIMQIIRDYYQSGLKGIFHSYAGNLEQALELTKNGFLIGVNGSVTFKNSQLATFINNIPLESIVTETDSPYLSPVPYRGKTNDPSRIPIIINKLSELYKIPATTIKATTKANALKLIN